MEEPRTLKDIQRLNGRLAALHRFLSRHAEKALPFFKILQGVHKKGQISWTAECSKAFADLKEYISKLPLMASPIGGDVLFLYWQVSSHAVSTVLIQEKDNIQQPVYFVSKVLKDAELNYPPLEKAAYSILITSRKLRYYFQAHPIVVLTNMPLAKVLEKPACSGRMLPWAIELCPSTASSINRERPSKHKHLADFLAEADGDDSNISRASSQTPDRPVSRSRVGKCSSTVPPTRQAPEPESSYTAQTT